MDRSVVEHIFSRMALKYGSQFADKWRGVDPVDLKEDWAQALAGFTPAEIRRGLESLSRQVFPPSQPEFVLLCRPPLDYEAAYVEAVNQMRIRHDGGEDVWSNPAIYWAGTALGFELRSQPYQYVKQRWKSALDMVLASPDVPPVPPKREALPAPGGTRVTRERMAQVFAEMDARRGVAPKTRNPDDAERDRMEYLAAEREIAERAKNQEQAA